MTGFHAIALGWNVATLVWTSKKMFVEAENESDRWGQRVLQTVAISFLGFQVYDIHEKIHSLKYDIDAGASLIRTIVRKCRDDEDDYR